MTPLWLERDDPTTMVAQQCLRSKSTRRFRQG
jgi:hypothetical protein